MTEPLGWPDVDVRPTPYREANGEIDVRAYYRPPVGVIIAGVLCWILIGAVVWGVMAVTP